MGDLSATNGGLTAEPEFFFKKVLFLVFGGALVQFGVWWALVYIGASGLSPEQDRSDYAVLTPLLVVVVGLYLFRPYPLLAKLLLSMTLAAFAFLIAMAAVFTIGLSLHPELEGF